MLSHLVLNLNHISVQFSFLWVRNGLIMIMEEPRGNRVLSKEEASTFSYRGRVNTFDRDRMNEQVGKTFTTTPTHLPSLCPGLTTLSLALATGFFFLFLLQIVLPQQLNLFLSSNHD